jgi:diguanylate cyclase (GGDEF)-like protein
VFCRWGGEEFVILLPETEGKDAFRIIEKLRQLISASMFSTDEHSATITFSAGIAEYPQKRDVDALLKAADLCLYEAKSNSRNKTVWLRTG